MKRILLALIVVPGLLFLTHAARACGMHPVPLAAIHNALPTPLPVGTIVADVEMDMDLADGILPYGMRVRVRRMIQGEAAPVLILRTERTNSCQDVFGNGSAGFIVAVPDGYRNGIPVVIPIFVHRNDGYRLPDGYQLQPPEERGLQIVN